MPLLVLILVIAAIALAVIVIMAIIAAIAAVIALILSIGGVLAAIAAGVGAAAAVYFWYHPMAWCVRNRGGDRHPPVEGRNAYRQYLAGPVFSDFWFSLREGVEASRMWLSEKVFPSARFMLDSPWTFVFAIGIYLGAFIGIVGGVLALSLLSIGGSLVLAVTVAIALATGFLLKVFERLRMKVAGAGYTCPGCHESFQLPVYRCPACGASHERLLPGSLGILKRRCSCDRAELPTLRASGRAAIPAECPSCEANLHGSIGGLRNVRVPITGGTGAGKTTLCVGALELLAQLEEAGQVNVTLRSESAPRFANLVTDLDRAELPPPTEKGAPGLLAEVTPKSGRGGLLFAYDVAGELFNNLDQLRDQTMFSGFEGAIMVVDPFSLDSIRTQFPEEVLAAGALANATETRPEDVYQRMVEALTELDAPLSKLALAIVVTKTDALPTDASLEVGGDVEAWLGEYGAGNLLLTATQDFGEVRCFGSSALGGPVGNSETFAPRGCLAPFAWIMGRKGIRIPEQLGAETEHVGGAILLEEGSGAEAADAFLVDPRNRDAYVPTSGVLSTKGAVASFAAIAIFVPGLAFLAGATANWVNSSPESNRDGKNSIQNKKGQQKGAAKKKGSQGRANSGKGKKQKAKAKKKAGKVSAKARAKAKKKAQRAKAAKRKRAAAKSRSR